MVCNVIDECRYYAYEDTMEQFCGVRRGPRVIPCPPDCCAGGCPGKYPFRIIKRPMNPWVEKKKTVNLDFHMKILIYMTVVLAGIFLLLL